MKEEKKEQRKGTCNNDNYIKGVSERREVKDTVEKFGGFYVLDKGIEFLLYDHKTFLYHHFYYLWYQKEVKLLHLTANMCQMVLRTIR